MAALTGRLRVTHPVVVPFSARTGEGVEDLVDAIAEHVRRLTTEVELFVPYARADMLAALHREGAVVSEHADDDGVHVTARLEPASLGQFESLLIQPTR